MKFGFAGDRDISVWILQFLVDAGYFPHVLLVSDHSINSHSNELVSTCLNIAEIPVLSGDSFRSQDNIEMIKAMNLDLFICIHFPYVIPSDIISIPSRGFVNLHPGLLPHGKGWHTPSWAILHDTPIGATLHRMGEKVDSGDILFQRETNKCVSDTAHALYERVKKTELELFVDCWESIAKGEYEEIPQQENYKANYKNDLADSGVQQIDLCKEYKGEVLLNKIRALTTNQKNEAAYFIKNGRKFRIQVEIFEDLGDHQ